MLIDTDLVIHDPSTLIRHGREWWVYGTGRGLPAFSSTDLARWKFRGETLPSAPAWVKDVVPGNTRNDIWAPDVYRVRDRFFVYYSVSTFGRNTSAIGLATSRSPEPESFTEQGVVVRSEQRDNFNAIDPAITESRDGRLWMSFGSFWSGIKMIELDPATGKRIAPDSPLYSLAAHPQERNNAIEAPFIHYRRGYYYLFVNWDYCCRGARSTYHIRVGRCPRITGPYTDRQGKDLLKGGGSLLIDSKHDDGSGAPFDDRVGPGHAGIISDRGRDWLSFHYEYVRAHNGRPMLHLRSLTWDRSGWPRLAPER